MVERPAVFFSAMLLALAGLLAGPAVAATAGEVTRCDELAAHPLDPARVAPGQSTGDIDLPLAIATCRDDVAAQPDNARIRYQLARVLFYAGQFDEAMVEMRRAAQDGHAQAQFIYGIFVIKERPGAPTDVCIAERNWQASAEGGRHAAAVHYAVQRLRGTFDGCDDPATAEELARWLNAAAAAAPPGYDGYYRRMFIDDLQYRLR
jgi:TPR repeat protein